MTLETMYRNRLLAIENNLLLLVSNSQIDRLLNWKPAKTSN